MLSLSKMERLFYYIRTFGCQMNERDSERIAALLEGMGYSPADDDNADIVVINTCSVREKPEHKVYSELGRYRAWKRRKRSAILAVAGCVAQQEGENLLKKVPHLDLVVGTRAIARLPELIENVWQGTRAVAVDMNTTIEKLFGDERPATNLVTAYVVAMTGCSNHCTYCIVPSVRGPAVSRPPSEIINEVKKLAQSGVKEITLLGQNVNAYGLDLKKSGFNDVPDFAQLLTMVSEVEGIERVRFVTSHPRDFSDATISVLAENPKICKYLHLPMQAGSDEILKKMGRGYSRSYYLDLTYKIREKVPDIALSSDFIVGFPGETEAHFEDTLEIIELVRYHQIYSFCYSERPSTPALKLEPKTDKEEKLRRLKILQEKQEAITSEWMEKMVGTTQKILIEGTSKTDDESSEGRTESNIPVHVRKKLEAGRIVTVRIKRALKHSLEGEMTDE